MPGSAAHRAQEGANGGRADSAKRPAPQTGRLVYFRWDRKALRVTRAVNCVIEQTPVAIQAALQRVVQHLARTDAPALPWHEFLNGDWRVFR
jgi:hypothetical protein